jgi:orotate phosphoribosyltransferase
MSKTSIYNDLFSSKTINIIDFTKSQNNKPYDIYINRILNNPTLFDNITLHIENAIKTKKLEFDKICATSISAIPYATNVSTSLEKSIAFINDTGNMKDEKNNIKNIKIEGSMDIDERILLIETIVNNDFSIENIIERIRKYGGYVVGLIIILNQCQGEYSNLSTNKELIIPVFNLFDIFTYLENNTLIEMFYSEKVKFYCEKITKINITKLIPPIDSVFNQ